MTIPPALSLLASIHNAPLLPNEETIPSLINSIHPSHISSSHNKSIIHLSDINDLRLSAAASICATNNISHAQLKASDSQKKLLALAAGTSSNPLAHPLVLYARAAIRSKDNHASIDPINSQDDCAQFLTKVIDKHQQNLPENALKDLSEIKKELFLFAVAKGRSETASALSACIQPSALASKLSILCANARSSRSETQLDSETVVNNILCPKEPAALARAKASALLPSSSALINLLAIEFSQTFIKGSINDLYLHIIPTFASIKAQNDPVFAFLSNIPALITSHQSFNSLVSRIGGPIKWKSRIYAIYAQLYLNASVSSWKSEIQTNPFFKNLFQSRPHLKINPQTWSKSIFKPSHASARSVSSSASHQEHDLFLRELLFSSFRPSEINHIQNLTPLIARMPAQASQQLLQSASALNKHKSFDHASQLAAMAKLCAITAQQPHDVSETIDKTHRSAALAQLINQIDQLANDSGNQSRINALADQILDLLVSTGPPSAQSYSSTVTCLIKNQKIDIILKHAHHLSQRIAESSQSIAAHHIQPNHVSHLHTLYNISRIMVLVIAMLDTLDRNNFPSIAYTLRMTHALDSLPDEVVREVYSFARQLSRWICESDPASGVIHDVHQCIIDILVSIGRKEAFGLLASCVGAVFGTVMHSSQSQSPSLQQSVSHLLPESIGTLASCASPTLVKDWPTESERRVSHIAMTVLTADVYTASDTLQLSLFLRKLCQAWASLPPTPQPQLTDTLSPTTLAMASVSPYWLLADIEFCNINQSSSSLPSMQHARKCYRQYLNGVLVLTNHLSRMDRLDFFLSPPQSTSQQPSTHALIHRYAQTCTTLSFHITSSFLLQLITTPQTTPHTITSLSRIPFTSISPPMHTSSSIHLPTPFTKPGSISTYGIYMLVSRNPFACFYDTCMLECIVYSLRKPYQQQQSHSNHSNGDEMNVVTPRNMVTNTPYLYRLSNDLITLVRIPEYGGQGAHDVVSRNSLVYAIQSSKFECMAMEIHDD